MANNKVSSLFNREFPKPPRSNFNLGRINRFTADVGYVIPCYVEEILPNSYKRLDIEALIQTNPTIAPLLGSFTAKFEAFFVPLRLYHAHLDLNSIRPNFHDDFDFHYIKTLSSAQEGLYNAMQYTIGPSESQLVSKTANLSVAPSSLIDYLGIMPVGHNSFSFTNSKRLNATPFIGYFDIYRNYYANPHDRLIPYRVQNYRRLNPESLANNIEDRYFNLDQLDVFITTVLKQSVNTVNGTISPESLDVMQVFQSTVYDHNYTSPIVQRVSTSVPFFAGQQSYNPDSINADFGFSSDTRDGLHFGLMRRTYKDDYFNSRFMNEFVTYLEENSYVEVEDNKFYITQLRLQNRIAKYIDKSIFSDTRFGSWIKAHFGVQTNNKLNIPQFLGSMSSNIIFQDVRATAQTGDGGQESNQALGSRAGLGQGYCQNKGSFVEFKATEPGYLMIMFSLVPNVSYFQGFKKMYLKSSFNDIYKPEFDAVGYQDLQFLETFGIGNLVDSYVSDYQRPRSMYLYQRGNSVPGDIHSVNVPIGKQVSWMEYMTSFDEAHGLMTKRNQLGYWLLNRPFDFNIYDEYVTDDSGSMFADWRVDYIPPVPQYNASTYILPELFNTIFAVNRYTDNFQVQVRFYDKTKQPISKQILPHL